MASRADTNSAGGHVWVRLVADPQSVPAARRFARDAVTGWRLPDLAEDAALCVSELATNAALHSGSEYLELALANDAGAVRIVVEDAAPATTDRLTRASAELGGEPAGAADEADFLASTGRGLFVVAALASQWGIEQTSTGKRIWVRLAHAQDYRPSPPQMPATAPQADRPRLPVGWHMLFLTGCPVELSVVHSRRIDDLLRELQLLDTGGRAHPRALADLIDNLLHGQGHARQLGRHLIQDAATQGMERVDLELPMPPGSVDRLRRLNQALDRADELCRQERLLTLASTPDMLHLRAWVQHELVWQIEHAQTPVSYDAWRRVQSSD